MTQQFVPPLTN